ncbi:MAG: D-glycero-beta-D-manno-heptose-7-phosphate kinase [Parachlamydiaceae bacterium]|nr:D-glycero-beta-D-manno-heptose-7-phosphate kinase [Parachlamydiaceae bacterium]
MVKLARTFGRLNPAKVMVIGDLLLDSYTIGKARRISPEAPVAVVHVDKEEHRPGGAGNVVLNLVSLGTEVVTIGRVGKDWAGDTLCEAFNKEGIHTKAIFVQDHYRTPVKNRIIADNQQIVRVDHEQIVVLSESLEQQIIDSLPQLIEDVKIIAISDYGKGFLTTTLLNAIIGLAKERGIPVITDPKGHDFSKYEGSTFIKPNLKEAYAAANLPINAPLETVAKRILQICNAEILMVTRSEAGISLFNANGERLDFPVRARQVMDVTGAGDTVLATLTCALANELSYAEAAQLCNVTAGIAIERMGCARVTLSDLAQRLLEEDVSNKVFDEEHLFALQEVLKTKPFTLLTLSNIKEISSALYKAIRNLSEKRPTLLLYIEDSNPDESYIDMLASFKDVSFILLHSQSLKLLCEKVIPEESYIFDGFKLEKVTKRVSIIK